LSGLILLNKRIKIRPLVENAPGVGDLSTQCDIND